MDFSPPLSDAERRAVRPAKIAVYLGVTGLRLQSPLSDLVKSSDAALEFEEAYLDYRLSSAGTPTDLERLAGQVRQEVGDYQGGEVVRLLVRAVDDAIAQALGVLRPGGPG